MMLTSATTPPNSAGAVNLPPISLISLVSSNFLFTSSLCQFSTLSSRRRNDSRVSAEKSRDRNAFKSSTGEVAGYDPDIIIVGAGVAGSALAYALGKLRRSLCNPKVDIPSCFVALVLENCELPYPNYGHVILANPSLAFFYPISSTEVRCFADIPGQKVPSISDGKLAQYLKSEVPSEVYDAFIAAIDKGNIRSMPNQSMPASPCPIPGVLLLGDAFDMRHPLTGGGMTVALSDIVLLRDLLRPLDNINDAFSLCKCLESFYTLPKPMSSTINTFAGAAYKIFSASTDSARNDMRDACFDFLSLGGVFSEGLISLLSGLNPCPSSLLMHFFAVAIYGAGRLLLPVPTPKGIYSGGRLISAAMSVIFPIMKAEGFAPMLFPHISTKIH